MAARKKRRVKRRKSSSGKVRRFKASSRRVRRYRRNPIGGSLVSSVKRTTVDGAIGAAGAIGLDLAYGYGQGYLPDVLKTGYGKVAAKALLSVLVGMVGGKVLRGRGSQLAVGAMTVVLHDFLKSEIQKHAPTLQLGEYLPYSESAGPIVGEYDGMSALPDMSTPSFGIDSFNTESLGEYMTY